MENAKMNGKNHNSTNQKIGLYSLGMVIGERLRELRVEKRLSQKDIEERTGLARPHISRIERGYSLPTLLNLTRFSKGLRVTLSALFYDGDKPTVTSMVNTEKLSGDSTRDAMLLRDLGKLCAKMPERKRKLLLDLARRFANGRG